MPGSSRRAAEPVAVPDRAAEFERHTPPAGGPASGACIISCAIGSRAEVDDVLARAAAAGGVVAAGGEQDGSSMGYFGDPDGHVWQLVLNARTAR